MFGQMGSVYSLPVSVAEIYFVPILSQRQTRLLVIVILLDSVTRKSHAGPHTHFGQACKPEKDLRLIWAASLCHARHNKLEKPLPPTISWKGPQFFGQTSISIPPSSTKTLLTHQRKPCLQNMQKNWQPHHEFQAPLPVPGLSQFLHDEFRGLYFPLIFPSPGRNRSTM